MIVDIQKNYLLGIVNLVTIGLLGSIVALLLVFHIDNYLTNVSRAFNWQFIWFDPFASRLIGLMLLSLVVSAVSCFVQFSEMFTSKSEQNWMALSITSLLWIILFLASSFSKEYFGLMVLPLTLVGLIVLMTRQSQSKIWQAVMYLISLVVWMAGYF